LPLLLVLTTKLHHLRVVSINFYQKVVVGMGGGGRSEKGRPL
jgi:hypothetical protein